MKNIAIDARFLLRQQRGMPLYAFMLCKHLPKIMPTYHFFLFINKGFEHNESEANYKERLQLFDQYNNVTVINTDAEDEISWEQKILPKLLAQYRIDLFHMPGNRVCFNTKVKQIVTFHDAMEWSQLSFIRGYEFHKGLGNALYSFKMKCYRALTYFWGMKKVNKVLTISQYSKNIICHYFPKVEQQTVYAHHGIPEGFSTSKQSIPIEKRRGILMLGGDSYQKNPENTLRAWSLLSDDLKDQCPLTIAGFTGGAESPLMQTLIELGIEKQVVILGWISSEQLIELFENAYLFLFISRVEGFGFPLLQAMSCGTPTVCSTADVLMEIGTNAIRSADSESPQQINQHIVDIVTNEAVWHELHKKSLLRSKDFDWKNTCQVIAQTYIDVLNEK